MKNIKTYLKEHVIDIKEYLMQYHLQGVYFGLKKEFESI